MRREIEIRKLNKRMKNLRKRVGKENEETRISIRERRERWEEIKVIWRIVRYQYVKEERSK